MNILLDFDDVIYDCYSILEKAVAEKFEKVNDSFNFTESYKATDEEIRDFLINESTYLDDMEPYNGAGEFLTYLFDNHNVLIITHRGFHPRGYEYTVEHIERLNVRNFDKRCVLSIEGDKLEWFKHTAHTLPDVVIDDSPSMIKSAIDNGIKYVVAPIKKYNSHLFENHSIIELETEPELFCRLFK